MGADRGSMQECDDVAGPAWVHPCDGHSIAAEERILRVRARFAEDGCTLLPDTIEAVQKLLDERGVCAVDGVLDSDVINSCHKEFLQSWQQLDQRMSSEAIDRRQALSFNEVSSRQFGRFDVHESHCGARFKAARAHAERIL